MIHNFEVITGSQTMRITAATNTAKGFICGMLEAYRIMGKSATIQLYNIESGAKVFELSI